MLLESNGTGGTVLLLVVVVALIIVVIVPRMLRRKRKTPASPFGNTFTAASAKSTMENLAVQLHEVGREMNAHLSTKMKTLDILIQEADEKIRTLRALAGEETEQSYKPPAQGIPAEETLSPKQLQVYQCSDAGMNSVDIARRTGFQPGEIELILELRKKMQRD